MVAGSKHFLEIRAVLLAHLGAATTTHTHVISRSSSGSNMISTATSHFFPTRCTKFLPHHLYSIHIQ